MTSVQTQPVIDRELDGKHYLRVRGNPVSLGVRVNKLIDRARAAEHAVVALGEKLKDARQQRGQIQRDLDLIKELTARADALTEWFGLATKHVPSFRDMGYVPREPRRAFMVDVFRVYVSWCGTAERFKVSIYDKQLVLQPTHFYLGDHDPRFGGLSAEDRARFLYLMGIRDRKAELRACMTPDEHHRVFMPDMWLYGR